MTYFSLFVLILCVGSALSQSACETKRLNTVKAGSSWKGTNLGSWFVLEYYMASYLWKQNNCTYERDQGSYLFEKCVGPTKAQELMEKHWSTWITETDFETMSKYGVNIVRLPVGWWNIYDPEGGAGKAKLNFNITAKDYVAGGLKYLDKAFDWGEKHGVGILLDLHGAPGSQNGYDNSSPGRVGELEWGKYADNVNQSIESLELYAKRYGTKTALVGFDVINEPANGWNGDNAKDLSVLQDFYKRAYAAIRKHSADSWILIMPIQPPSADNDARSEHWTKFMTKDQGYTKVGMDIHLYSAFGGAADQTTVDGVINYVKKEQKDYIAEIAKVNPHPILIGEWSACMHADESKYGDFFRAEVEVYSTASLGFTFWSWTDQSIRNEHSGNCDGDAWSLKAAFKDGWIGNLTTAC